MLGLAKSYCSYLTMFPSSVASSTSAKLTDTTADWDPPITVLVSSMLVENVREYMIGSVSVANSKVLPSGLQQAACQRKQKRELHVHVSH